MPIPLFQVDAFAERPFTGNPAAVCLLDGPAEADWMQHVAAEMNLSETAFLHPTDHGYTLRWFTPAAEVELCGHATLASAHVLYESRRLAPEAEARFQTASGLLTVRQTKDDRLAMDFPATPPEETDVPPAVAAAVGGAPVWTGRTVYDVFVEVADEATVRALALPDAAANAALDARALLVTARADAEQPYDFVSRLFAANVGIPEDPVTGSAHCALAPYWRERFGASPLTGYQASARGGLVGVEVKGERVVLTGRAITVFRGDLVA